MTELTKILRHERKLKTAMKDMSLEEVISVREKIERIIKAKEEEAEIKEMEEAERREKLEEVQKMLEESGLSINDLSSAVSEKPKKAKKPCPPKYKIETPDGEVTWTGRGKMPVLFKQALEQGHTIEEYLI